MDSLKVLEKQSGFLRLIYYLGENGEKTVTEIIDEADIPVHQLYASIDKAIQLKLVKRRIDATSYPNRNMISLTRRGKELSRKLEEITGLLSPE
jgi:DNA-binding MarR family transcriptional regulator